MMFILSMEPLQRLLGLATVHGILTPLASKAARLCMSMYANDAALFINPKRCEMSAVKATLESFGRASGLKINASKCVAYPIRCEDLEFETIIQDFGGMAGSLPCRYLGLPLGVRKPRRAELLPILDRMAGRLKGWKGKLMARPGRLNLIASVLTSTATYFLTCFKSDKWARKRMHKICRNF